MVTTSMRTDQFDFDLSEDRIALRPMEPRDSARLLVVGSEGCRDCVVKDLTEELRPGDVLVFNNTRVIPAALEGVRIRGEARARIQANLHKRVGDDRWRAFVRPARKLDIGDRVRFGDGNNSCLMGALDATVAAKFEGGEVEFQFDLGGPVLDSAIAGIGEMPLPPYIASRRPADIQDLASYQTVYAKHDGAVAAPTAGLHFTDGLFAELAERGIGTIYLTLHVGAGTFLPVKADEISEHKMHAEWGEVSAEAAAELNQIRANGGRLIAVGTTVVRLLESAVSEQGDICPFSGDTDIFISPGYKFGAIDGMMTNFHLPRSTLFMLVSAFAGLERMQQAYAHAIESGYRFYSYGDSSLLWPMRGRDD